MKEFFSYIGKDYDGVITLTPIERIIPVIMSLLIIMILFVFGEKLTILKRRGFQRSMGVLLLIVWSSYFIWHLAYGKLDSQSLPISLCSLTSIGFIIVYLTDHQKVLDIVFYWGFLGGLLALLFVNDVYKGPEHFRYYEFYLDHTIILMSPFYFLFVKGYNPTLKSTFLSLLSLILAGLITLPVNLAYHMDYMIMNPYTAPVGTPADTIAEMTHHNIILYVLVLIVLSVIVYSILYLFFILLRFRGDNVAKSTVSIEKI